VEQVQYKPAEDRWITRKRDGDKIHCTNITISWTTQGGGIPPEQIGETCGIDQKTVNASLRAFFRRTGMSPDGSAVTGRIASSHSITVAEEGRAATGFPRIWALFAYLLPKAIRESAYEPSRQDLLEDYLLARRSYRTKWARRWLAFCFTFRTAVLVIQSLRAMLGEKGLRCVRWLAYATLGGNMVRGLRWAIFEVFKF
jgi:hypothetical protein